MESTLLAMYLFAVLFMFLSWLVTPLQNSEKTILTPETPENTSFYLNTLENNHHTKAILDLTILRTYKMHGHSCVKLKDLPVKFRLPPDVKTYKLRGEKVIKLATLEKLVH